MRAALFPFLCWWSLALTAQPTIQIEDAPQAGNVWPIEPYTALWEILPGGEDQVWDLSGMESSGPGWTLRFALADTTPGFAVYPDAQLACLQDGFLDNWWYYSVTDFGLERLGIYFTDQNYAAAPYPERMMPYPGTYGTAWLDTVQWCSDSNVCRVNRYTCSADGYGSLILPAGTVPNVLRTRCITGTYSDLGGDIWADTLMLDRYWSPDMTYILATVYNSIEWHNDEMTFMVEAELLADLTVGVSSGSMARSSATAFYSSGTGDLTIAPGLCGRMHAEVMDGLGRMIKSTALGHFEQDQQRIVMALPRLPNGNYLLRIGNGEGLVEYASFMVVE